MKRLRIVLASTVTALFGQVQEPFKPGAFAGRGATFVRDSLAAAQANAALKGSKPAIPSDRKDLSIAKGQGTFAAVGIVPKEFVRNPLNLWQRFNGQPMQDSNTERWAHQAGELMRSPSRVALVGEKR